MLIPELMVYIAIEAFAVLLIIGVVMIIYNRRLKKRLMRLEKGNKAQTAEGNNELGSIERIGEDDSNPVSIQSQKHVQELQTIVEKFSKETREMLNCIHLLEKENTELRDQLNTRKSA